MYSDENNNDNKIENEYSEIQDNNGVQQDELSGQKEKKKSLFTLVVVGIVITCLVSGFFAITIATVWKYIADTDHFRQASDNFSTSSFISTASERSQTPTAAGESKYFSIEDASKLQDSENKKALSTIDIASRVGSATVSVIAEMTFNSGYGDSIYESSGSGFIISEDGYIVTNNHVISGGESITVIIPGQDEPLPATIVGTDTRTDIAVLKVETGMDLPYVVFGDSDLLQVGEMAVAIGNPFGELAGTVTVGVISALNREIMIESTKYNLLQTDASINSGNSGGPLVNSYGEVIGVTNAKISDGEGIGFAIPINDVKDIIEELINIGYVSGRPVLGVVVVAVDEWTAQQYNWPIGVYVREVSEKGPADKAGLEVGDIIMTINGQDIESTQTVLDIRDGLAVGDEMKLSVFRAGETISLTLILEEENAS